MSGLILTLAPKERVLINGAVVENSGKRSRLAIVTPQANILRLRDAIHPEAATTPVRRLCYSVQLVLSGDATPSDARLPLLRHIEELSQVMVDADSRNHLAHATQAVIDGQFYRCLKALRSLLPREDRLLARCAL